MIEIIEQDGRGSVARAVTLACAEAEQRAHEQRDGQRRVPVEVRAVHDRVNAPSKWSRQKGRPLVTKNWAAGNRPSPSRQAETMWNAAATAPASAIGSRPGRAQRRFLCLRHWP